MEGSVLDVERLASIVAMLYRIVGMLLNDDLVTFICEPALWPTWLWGFGGEDNADDRKAKISFRVNE